VRIRRGFQKDVIHTKHQPVPIRAWKAAHIAFDGFSLRFRGIAIPLSYDAESSTFECFCGGIPEVRHKTPDVDSSCGWYALNTAELVRKQYKRSFTLPDTFSPPWLLEVDLWGTVIKCSKGYRASRQRVLSARPLFAKPQTWNDVFGASHERENWPFRPVHRDAWGHPIYLSDVYYPAALAAQLKTEVYYE
jgi:hypothetical protein